MDDALLRAAVGTPVTTPWPDLSNEDGPDRAAWSRWIAEAWGLPGVADAVTVASPALAARVEAATAGLVASERRLRRIGGSLVRYLLRMRHRATPFGLFAGVAPVRLGDKTSLAWSEEHRAIARPDAAWLAAVVDRLEQDRALLGQLTVTADTTCRVRGERLVLPCRQPSAPDGKPQEVTVRRTPPVDAILAAARDAVRVDDLVHKVTAEFPDAPPGAVLRLVTQLVRQRVLITSLRTPMAEPDPLGHVISQLRQTAPGPEGPHEPALARLGAVHDRLDRHNAENPALQPSGRSEVLNLMA
ncbi:lantibiotic dehydratase, partial [Streptomyces sp. NRRL S-495]|uniref:lantibiotic dehydratase n=1 Tax=Streptomyces sp. NRRL S-495 TaxID=1609133 RepID=UPI00190174AE